MAAVAAAAPPNLSSVVRALLHAQSNKPMRANALWDAVRAGAPSLARSKTHFKRRIMQNMIDREEVRRRAARTRARRARRDRRS